MKIVRCDICNNEMRTYIFARDSETQHYTLINSYDGRDIETDICNGCMHKLIDFVKAPSVVPSRAEGEWIAQGDCGVTKCNICGWSIEECIDYNYCPDCGAKMKGAE